MKSLHRLLPWAAALALVAVPVAAEKADRAKPMNVEADALRHDDLRQTSVFTGRVVVTKGTILIRGARVEVRQDAEGFQHGVVTAEPGQRAYFRQKREAMDEYIEGEAQMIEYDGRADRVRFVGSAELRRLRGTTVSDEMTGSLITYDNTNDVYTVDGGPAAGAAPAQGGRVRAILAPRPAASGAAAVPAMAASAAQGASSAPRLRSTSTLAAEPR